MTPEEIAMTQVRYAVGALSKRENDGVSAIFSAFKEQQLTAREGFEVIVFVLSTIIAPVVKPGRSARTFSEGRRRSGEAREGPIRRDVRQGETQ